MLEKLSYQVIEGWEQLPFGFRHLDVDGVAVDSQDRVYAITRSDPRVIVYERDGTFVRSWGEGEFSPRTHGITVTPDGHVFCVDEGSHTVRKYTLEGKLLMTIGTPGVASDTGYDGSAVASIKRGGSPFNRPTYVALGPGGDIYVADGYGNARVHRFTADGELIQSWGEPGTGPGQFNLPHGVAITPDARLLVADRENDRIQVFSLDGEYVDQWTNVQRPTAVVLGPDGLIYVSELAWLAGQRSFVHGEIPHDLPGRVSVLDPEGHVFARFGDSGDPYAPGNLYTPHDLCVDSRGDIYVGEVAYSFSGRGKAGLVPPNCHTLQKFTRA